MDVCDNPGLRGGDGPSDALGDIVNLGNMEGGSIPAVLSLRCPRTSFGGVSMLTRLLPLCTSIAGPRAGWGVVWLRLGETGDIAALSIGAEEFELVLTGDAGRMAGVEPPGVE